jgi:hypothetical protein
MGLTDENNQGSKISISPIPRAQNFDFPHSKGPKFRFPPFLTLRIIF